MKKNLLKAFAVVALLAAGGSVDAQETYVGTPTVDTWLRKGNTANHGSETTVELQTFVNDTKDVDMVGVMVFEFTSPNSGYEIESASLRLVSERVKGDRNINIYDFDAEINEDAKYADYETKISAVREQTPVAKFSMEGQLGKSVAYDEITSEKYQAIAGWQNRIDLTEYVKSLSTNKFGILITRASNVGESSKIFTKEATVIENPKCNYFNDVTADDLVPQLTVTYTVASGISDINAGAQKQADGAVYNLAGQRVSNPQHGIYVKNGRKYIVK